MRREHRRQARSSCFESARWNAPWWRWIGKKKIQIKRNEIRARVTKIEVYPRGSECEDNRGPTRLDPPSFGEARDGPPRSAREFRQPSGARDDRSRVRGRVRFSCFRQKPRAVHLKKRGVQPGNLRRFASIARCSARSIDGELSLRYRWQAAIAIRMWQWGNSEKILDPLPNNRRVTAHPSRSCVLSSTRGQLLQGRPRHPPSHRRDSANNGNPFGTASVSSVRPSHGTAGRASIIRHTGTAANTRGAQIPQHLGVPLTRVAADDVRVPYEDREDKSLASVTYGERARGQALRSETRRSARYPAVQETRNDERASFECASRSPASLAPLTGLRVEREKHRRTFEGSTATPTGVVAVTPARLSRQPACYVSPAAPTPPQRGRRHPRASPHLIQRPTPSPSSPLDPAAP